MIPTVLSLWNTFVENESRQIADQVDKHPIIICRRLKVVTYNGIALSTRSDSIILVDPPVGDARMLRNWASRNQKELLVLVQDKPYSNQTPEMFYGPQQKITTIRDVLRTEKVSWVKCMFSFEHMLQKYWYMACLKCRRLTLADYACSYTCNHCNEKQTAQPRCRFDIGLTDHTGTLTASIFGEQAETLLGFTAVQAMDYFTKNEELPLANLHENLKNKMLIVQLKPGTTKISGLQQRYTVAYYFEDNTDNAADKNLLALCSQGTNSKNEGLVSATLVSVAEKEHMSHKSNTQTILQFC